jgi:hypothetical protein
MSLIGSDDDIILAHRVLSALTGQWSVQKTRVPILFCGPEESKED